MISFADIAYPEAVLGVLMIGTWWWVLRQRVEYAGWRRTASLVGLALPTLALIIELLLAGILAHYGSLRNLDEASLRGGWPAFVGRALLGLSLATGLLSFGGLVLAVVGKGNPRIAAVIWSCVILGTFFVNLVLSVNSFH